MTTKRSILGERQHVPAAPEAGMGSTLSCNSDRLSLLRCGTPERRTWLSASTARCARCIHRQLQHYTGRTAMARVLTNVKTNAHPTVLGTGYLRRCCCQLSSLHALGRLFGRWSVRGHTHRVSTLCWATPTRCTEICTGPATHLSEEISAGVLRCRRGLLRFHCLAPDGRLILASTPAPTPQMLPLHTQICLYSCRDACTPG